MLLTTLSINQTPYSCTKPKSFSFSRIRGIYRFCKRTFGRAKCRNSTRDSALSKAESIVDNKSPVLTQLFKRSDFQEFVLAFTGFSVIALLVCSGDSSNFLLSLDQWIHDWVQTNINPTLRSTLFRHWVSDFFIQLDLFLGPVFSLMILLNNGKKGLMSLSLSLLFFVGGTGSHEFEGTLLHYVKLYFHRVRPDPSLYAYSFPSGHCLATVFLTRIVFYNLLPLVIQTQESKLGLGFSKKLEENKASFLGLSFLLTMIGRVGADVHWFSDTLASFCLATVLSITFSIPFSYITNSQNSETKGKKM